MWSQHLPWRFSRENHGQTLVSCPDPGVLLLFASHTLVCCGEGERKGKGNLHHLRFLVWKAREIPEVLLRSESKRTLVLTAEFISVSSHRRRSVGCCLCLIHVHLGLSIWNLGTTKVMLQSRGGGGGCLQSPDVCCWSCSPPGVAPQHRKAPAPRAGLRKGVATQI